MKDNIVSVALAAMAFNVRERTVANWIVSSWGMQARVVDPDSKRAAMVDVDILYECLRKTYPDRDYSGYMERLNLERAKIRKDAQTSIEKEVTHLSESRSESVQNINTQVKPAEPAGQVELIHTLSNLIEEVKSIRPDHNLLSQTTALASRKNAEIERVQQQVEQLQVQNQQLQVKARSTHYMYIIILIAVVFSAGFIAWVLDDKSDNLKVQLSTSEGKVISAENTSKQIQDKLDKEQSSRAELTKLYEQKQLDMAKQLELVEQLADKNDETARLKADELNRQIRELQEQIKTLEAENLLLMNNQKSVSMEPNQVASDGGL